MNGFSVPVENVVIITSPVRTGPETVEENVCLKPGGDVVSVL